MGKKEYRKPMMRISGVNANLKGRRTFPEQITYLEYRIALSLILKYSDYTFPTDEQKADLKRAWEIKRKYMALINKYNKYE
jgi:hypothetical protein